MITRQKHVRAYSQITAAPLEWLWPGRMAAGMLTLLDGDPGQGKSLLSLDLAARLSTGRAFPEADTAGGPADVVLLACEDSQERTIRRRLEAAGADADRIHDFQVCCGDGAAGSPILPRDLDLLADVIREHAARLVIVDPLFAFLSGSVCDHHFVRCVLGQLARLAEQTGAAFLLLRHLTKGGRGQRALYRGSGGMAVVGAARTAFLVGPHPDNPEVALLVCPKINVGPAPLTLAYRILDDSAGARIEWLGPTQHTPDDVVLTPATLPPEAPRPAVALLQDLLGNGPATRETVVRLARAQDISIRSLERAKAELNIASTVQREHDRNIWYWSLPRDEDSERILRDLFKLDEPEEQPIDPLVSQESRNPGELGA